MKTFQGRTAVITLNRPDRLNAFRLQTLEEMADAFEAVFAPVL